MVLLERSDSLERLGTAFEQAILGRGQTVFVSGEAGIGKTALVRSFLAAHKDRYILMEGFCDSLFAARPLGPLFDIAHQLGPEFSALLKSNPGREQLFPAAFEALENQTRPIVLLFEDIQWADEATLDFIRFLARRVKQLQCLFILTLRDTELLPTHPYRMILGELPPTDYHKLQLTPLSRETVSELAGKAGRDADEIFRLTGGIPYYVSEVLASYHIRIPDTVKDSILSLYHRQFDQTRELWEKISVIPGRIELEILREMHTSSSRVVEFCYRAGIIIDDGYAISFKHELFREAIEESLSPHRKRELHQLAVESMLKAKGIEVPVARIVHHARLAGDTDRLREYAPLAAREASALGSHAEAAKFYALALEHSSNLSANELARLYEQYSYECYLTNMLAEAIDALEKALALWEDEAYLPKGNIYRLLSRLYWYEGDNVKSETLGRQAIDYCSHEPASRELAMAYSNMAQLMMLTDATEECLDFGQKAITLADALHDHEVLSHALNNIGMILIRNENTSVEGEAKLKESLTLSLQHRYHEHAARAYTNLAFAYVELGYYPQAEVVMDEGLGYCHDRNLYSWHLNLQCTQASLLLRTGRWDEADALCATLLEYAHPSVLTRISLEAVQNTVRLRRGEDIGGDFKLSLDEAKQRDDLERMLHGALVLLENEWLYGVNENSEIYIQSAFNKLNATHQWWFYREVLFWAEKTGRVKHYDVGGIQYQVIWKNKSVQDPYLSALMQADGNEEEQRKALSVLRSMGAHAAADRIEGVMRESGMSQIPRGPRDSTKNNVAGLTIRQMEVLAQMAEGLQNKEIADKLFLSTKTVDHHISDILSKLDVNTRAKAVARAMELGLLEDQNKVRG